MRYDLVVRSRRAVLPDGTRPAAVAVSGPAIAAIGDYGETAGGQPGGRPRRARPAARPGRHPRARQRARPDRVGGLRHRHPRGRGRRRDHDLRHAAQLAAAHRVGRGARGQARRRRRASAAVDVAFWGGAVPGNAAELRAAARGRRGRLQVLPGRLRGARVPAAGRGRAAGGAGDRWPRWTRC